MANQQFSFMHNRLAMAVTQAPPLLAIKLGAAPTQIFIIQSLAFALPYFISLSIVIFVFKDLRSAVLIALFYWLGGSEIHYAKEWGMLVAINLAVLLASFLRTRFEERLVIHLAIACFLIFLMIMTHQSSLCFLLILLIVLHRRMKASTQVLFLSVGLITGVVSYSMNEYIVQRVSESLVVNFLSPGARDFLRAYTGCFAFIFTALSGAYFLYKRKFRTETWLILLVAAGFVLLTLNYLGQYEYSRKFSWYFEGSMLMVVCSLCYIFLYELMVDRRLFVLLAIIAVLRFAIVNFTPNPVHANTVLKEKLLLDLNERYPDKKIFILREESGLLLEHFPDIFLKHESYLMSSYLLDRHLVLYATNDTTTYIREGRPVFVNQTGTQKADIDDPDVMNYYFDPVREFPGMNIRAEDIGKL